MPLAVTRENLPSIKNNLEEFEQSKGGFSESEAASIQKGLDELKIALAQLASAEQHYADIAQKNVASDVPLPDGKTEISETTPLLSSTNTQKAITNDQLQTDIQVLLDKITALNKSLNERTIRFMNNGNRLSQWEVEKVFSEAKRRIKPKQTELSKGFIFEQRLNTLKNNLEAFKKRLFEIIEPHSDNLEKIETLVLFYQGKDENLLQFKDFLETINNFLKIVNSAEAVRKKPDIITSQITSAYFLNIYSSQTCGSLALLPSEIIFEIFKHISSLKSLLRLSQVNKTFNKIVNTYMKDILSKTSMSFMVEGDIPIIMFNPTLLESILPFAHIANESQPSPAIEALVTQKARKRRCFAIPLLVLGFALVSSGAILCVLGLNEHNYWKLTLGIAFCLLGMPAACCAITPMMSNSKGESEFDKLTTWKMYKQLTAVEKNVSKFSFHFKSQLPSLETPSANEEKKSQEKVIQQSTTIDIPGSMSKYPLQNQEDDANEFGGLSSVNRDYQYP